ncbi:MAG TPA: 4'-phosphopantetheinyl transferase superfamily protein [Propionicimonas sp.]|uniref:4'-phosphopantetheinyl transferase superfamily protein n=1 Tax=Propionicimonas sp. TaxID=1955623 RepID=UPI002F3EFC01
MKGIVVGPATVVWSPSVDDRQLAFARSRALVTDLVGKRFPDAAGWSIGSAACPRCGERHGPVELSGVPAVAGVSYAKGLVVAALAPSDSVGQLGVDVELDAADATRISDVERLIGSAPEPLLRRWTRIEAVLKADGRGLLVDPGDVRFDGDTAMIAGDRSVYRVADVDGPGGYVISLAWCDAGSSAASAGQAIR